MSGKEHWIISAHASELLLNEANAHLMCLSLHSIVCIVAHRILYLIIPHYHHLVVIGHVIICPWLDHLERCIGNIDSFRLAQRTLTILVATLRHESFPCNKLI